MPSTTLAYSRLRPCASIDAEAGDTPFLKKKKLILVCKQNSVSPGQLNLERGREIGKVSMRHKNNESKSAAEHHHLVN
jgi:hypothetical protein